MIKDILAKMFYNLAKLPIIQRYYIWKYDFHHVIEDDVSIIYSGSQWIDMCNINSNESWKHRAGILGLSNNPLVTKLLI